MCRQIFFNKFTFHLRLTVGSYKLKWEISSNFMKSGFMKSDMRSLADEGGGSAETAER